jgi:hypothetical protein
MSTQRKRYSAELTARVALEALKGHKTLNCKTRSTSRFVGEERPQ